MHGSVNAACSDTPPLVSIITVVLNDASYIEETIKSVLSQNFESMEYIIVDGGSTDGTLDVIHTYDEHIDHWLSEPDRGVYDAMNKGIRLCSGRIVKIINSGDTLCKDAIKTAMEAFQRGKNESGHIVRSFIDLIDSNGAKLELIKDASSSRFYPSILHPSWYVPKQIYDRLGEYDTRYFVASDYEFYQRVVREGVEFTTIENPLVRFRTGGISGKGMRGQKEVFHINCRYQGFFVACYVYAVNFGARVRNRMIRLGKRLAASFI